MVATRCKHEKLLITENGYWLTHHDREESGEWSHYSEPAEYNFMLVVKCRSCGREWEYSRFSAPKWLKLYLDEIGI